VLEVIYNAGDNKRIDPDSVTDFCTQFVHRKDEELFYEVIREVHYAGFREGMKAALELIADLL